MSPFKILIVDDEEAIRNVLRASLSDEKFEVETAEDGEAAFSLIEKFKPSIILLDIWMPGRLDGLEVLQRVRSRGDDIDFIVMSGHGTIETAVRATKLGAWDFVEKPLSMDRILILIKNILAFQMEKKEKLALLSKLRRDIYLVGGSSEIVNLKQLIARLASGPSWILIQGEEGTGKGLTALNIHYLSDRAARPFIEVNCRNIPDELFEAELFGFEADTFLTNTSSKRGKLELADGGTLFLEHVEEIPLSVQEKLNRFLSDGQFCKVGGSVPILANVRIIASSTEKLAELCEQGRFLTELYDRLTVAPFLVPPLRSRPEDIPSLVNHFKLQFEREGGHKTKLFSDEALACLQKYAWPGNVRELRNFIERVYILTPGDFVDVHDLHFAGLSIDSQDFGFQDQVNFREARARFEKEFLQKKINENQGNISKTAETIGLERSYLHRKIKAYGIDV